MKVKIPEELEGILRNNTAGSTEVLRLLNSFFLNNLDKKLFFQNYISEASGRLTSFGGVQNYLKELKAVLLSNEPEALQSFLQGFEKSLNSLYLNLYENAKPFIQNFHTIITISNSSTLLEVFTLWKSDNPRLKVIVSESRPKCEGRIFAEGLLKNGISVELITDSMASELTKKADAAIIGADMILSNGNIVNKSGSRMLALSAKYYNKPFLVITGRVKFSSAAEYTPEDYPPEELWKFSHEGLKVTNHYFEEVEHSLITQIISL